MALEQEGLKPILSNALVVAFSTACLPVPLAWLFMVYQHMLYRICFLVVDEYLEVDLSHF